MSSRERPRDQSLLIEQTALWVIIPGHDPAEFERFLSIAPGVVEIKLGLLACSVIVLFLPAEELQF